ncbi:zinc transporter ZIP10-like isoform X2 [Hydractinia symbiolongicarpus]|uniref:zinc transporter ZIP10-like isoform X2 n=1 Tax=Hydractinia symbiolongicarpus TaxID=13093 RepID=UPI00254E5CBB|nr:zinc transporter ZIP10-like isoform X2 [Hydractinia symbiolongicarpus]
MLAVGTLLGDSLLHLIPKSFAVHEHHTSHKNATHTNDIKELNMLCKSILIIASLYALYLFNWLTALFGCGHTHSHNGDMFGGMHEHTHSNKSKPSIERIEDLLREANNSNDRDKYLNSFTADQEKEVTLEELSNIGNAKMGGNFENNEKVKKRSISQMVYVVVLSALLHNITDGMAIGVAFADCLSGGISTTVAVLCHEIPHVIGNFVIIHAAGCTIQLTLVLVMAAYVPTFIGGYVGVAIGMEFEATDYIFAVTAGMFLYVAMVQLLPEMLHAISDERDLMTFCLQNLGFLIGFVIMALIAFYEDSISIHF